MPDHKEPGLKCDGMANNSIPVQSSQNSIETSGQDATTSPEPAFTYFPKLPVELQNMIWAYCFNTSRVLSPQDNDSPAGLCESILAERPLRFQRYKSAGYKSPPPPPALHACKASREEGKRYGYFAFGIGGESFRGVWFNPNYDTILLGQNTLRSVPVGKLKRYLEGVKHLIIHVPVRYQKAPPGFVDGRLHPEQDQRDQQWNAELRDVWAPGVIHPTHSGIANPSNLGGWTRRFRLLQDVVPSCESICLAVTSGFLPNGRPGHQLNRVDDKTVSFGSSWKQRKTAIQSEWQRDARPAECGAPDVPRLTMYEGILRLKGRVPRDLW